MADISHEELMQLVGPAPPVRITRAPLATLRQALQRTTPTGEIIPLDTTSGAPFRTRLDLSMAPDEDTRKALLQKAFSAARIEPLPDNRAEGFVIRDYVDQATGQTKDLLVDEEGLTIKDLADMGQVGMEIFGAYTALRGGRGLTKQIPPGVARTVSEAALAATGSQIAGAATDVIARQQAGQPVNPLEIAQRRNVGAVVETGADLALGLPIAAGVALLNTRRGIPSTPEAAAGVAARNRLAESTGEVLPFTLGQQVGSERIRQSEEFLENVMLGGGPQRKFRLSQEAAAKRLQNRVVESMGPVPEFALPDKDVIGGRAVSALRSLATSGKDATTQARADAMTAALDDIVTAMQTSTGMMSRRILGSEAGEAARTFINLKHEALGEIEEQLGKDVDRLIGNQPFIPTPVMKREVGSIIKRAYERPGQPGELMTSMPATLKPILVDIQALDANVDLAGIRRIRHSINRQISQGEILGDTDTGVLKQLSKTLTETIRNAAGNRLTPQAAVALKRYNQFYSEGIEGFQTKGITEILADPTQRKLGPGSIFDQAAGSRDQYFRLKEAMTKPLMLDGHPVGPVQAGEASWNTFKQAMWQEMWDESRKTGNRSLIDPKKLMGRLRGLKVDVMDDLLGPQADVTLRSLGRLEVLDNPKLPADEAIAILQAGGDMAPTQIMELAKREADLDKLYDNQVIKLFIKGDIGSELIRPGEFVDRFADSAPLADVRDALNKLESEDPGLTLLIRQKKAQSLLESAKDPLSDVASAKKLSKEISSPEQQTRLEAVLGKPGLQRMHDLLIALGTAQGKAGVSARTGGSMAGGAQTAKLTTLTGIISALPKQAQYFFTSTLLSNPRLYRMATHPVQPLDPTKLIRAIILTDDFAKGLADEFGNESESVMDQFLNVKGASSPGDISHGELERSLSQPK